jgi:nucleoside-diphosphate-sugar epimerase
MCAEDSAYPAAPDTEYGWEKLFSERLYAAYAHDYGMIVRIARFHNIFGPEGTWQGDKEKAPAALCRKISMADDGGTISIWGDGEQTRSFLYIDECLDGIRKLMDDPRPVLPVLNIGSEEMITINNLAKMIAEISGKQISTMHVRGPQGVRGRNSDNTLIKKTLHWAPASKLRDGITKTYAWINTQVQKSKTK